MIYLSGGVWVVVHRLVDGLLFTGSVGGLLSMESWDVGICPQVSLLPLLNIRSKKQRQSGENALTSIHQR